MRASPTHESTDSRFGATLAFSAAGAEAVHGDLGRALSLYDEAIDAHHQAGNVPLLAVALGNLALCFDRLTRPEVAASLYGATFHNPTIAIVAQLPAVADRLRDILGNEVFDRCVKFGAGLGRADAVLYAKEQIRIVGQELGASRAKQAPPTVIAPDYEL